MSVRELFKKYEDEYSHFERIEAPISRFQDLHAFVMLEDYAKDGYDLIVAAEHDEIFFNIDFEKLEKSHEYTIRDLLRCGVRISEFDNLCMFV